MAEDPRPLTRPELAQFLPTQRAIRAFEKLFNLIPGDLITLLETITEVRLESDSALSRAQEALDCFSRIAAAMEQLAQAPIFALSEGDGLVEAVVEPEIEDLATIASETIFDELLTDLAPISELGTMAAQQADSVEITGGTVKAALTQNSTTFLTTSQALTNAAAAAAATLLNSPTAGNPTKWVPVNDNGTTRYSPLW